MEVSDELSKNATDIKNTQRQAWWHPKRPFYRFMLMTFACGLCLGVYMAYDSIGAISPYLKHGLTIDQSKYSNLVAAYALPNVVLAFLGGILTDKIGYNKSSILFSVFVILGNCIIAAAKDVDTLMLGRFVFGLGGESLIVAQTTMLSRWFSDHELGLAFGVSLAVGFLGSSISYNILPSIAESRGYSAALWFSAGICMISFVLNIFFIIADTYAERVLKREALYEKPPNIVSSDNPFHGERETVEDYSGKKKPSLSDVLRLPFTYWITVFICLTFYGAMTFTSYATDLMYNKYEYDEESAAQITSIIYFSGAILSPAVGWFVDMWGLRVQLMTIGNAIIVPAFLLLALTSMSPVFPIILLGLAYSLVPSVLWTVIPLIVEEQAVGKAFGLSYSLYDGVIFAVPLIYGNMETETGDSTWGMLFYAFLALAATLGCVPLWYMDKKFGGNVLTQPQPGEKIQMPCSFLNRRDNYVLIK